MSNFDDAVKNVLENEGGLSDQNKHDKGGITKFGISLRFLKSLDPAKLRAYGIYSETISDDDIKHLNRDQAKAIYKGEFWDQAPFEKITNPDVARYIFDAAVNMGINPAVKIAQRAVWAIMKRRTLTDDGIMGTHTIMAINHCNYLLLSALRSERGGYYRLIAQADADQQNNLNGWLNRAYESR